MGHGNQADIQESPDGSFSDRYLDKFSGARRPDDAVAIPEAPRGDEMS